MATFIPRSFDETKWHVYNRCRDCNRGFIRNVDCCHHCGSQNLYQSVGRYRVVNKGFWNLVVLGKQESVFEWRDEPHAS